MISCSPPFEVLHRLSIGLRVLFSSFSSLFFLSAPLFRDSYSVFPFYPASPPIVCHFSEGLLRLGLAGDIASWLVFFVLWSCPPRSHISASLSSKNRNEKVYVLSPPSFSFAFPPPLFHTTEDGTPAAVSAFFYSAARVLALGLLRIGRSRPFEKPQAFPRALSLFPEESVSCCQGETKRKPISPPKEG